MTGHELIIRAGRIVDGSGGPIRTGDIAIDDGVITAVGRVFGTGHREINADGAIVAPGFVDIHTHYDGQAAWDDRLTPSSWHGVTTAIMGNCGVGFAPVRSSDHQRLIELMEGVEDIPGVVLEEGLPWEWQSFPEYLDFLDRYPRDIDLGAQVPHAAMRLHVMGERGTRREPATPSDIAAMAQLAREAMTAGALGFTTSRTLFHRSSKGELSPTLAADAAELLGIAKALGSIGRGVLQVVSDFDDVDGEFELLRSVASQSGRPMSISIGQYRDRPELWRVLLDRMEATTKAGVVMRGQVAARGIGVLLGFEGSVNPFMLAPEWSELARLPMAERIVCLRQGATRRALIAGAEGGISGPPVGGLIKQYDLMFPLGDPPVYEPDPAASVRATSRRQNRPESEVAYDMLLERNGKALLYMPVVNYVDGSLAAVGEQLAHPASVVGLSDGGAHVGTLCDVSFPTSLLQLWGRDRPTGRLPIELLVHKQTRATATAVGLLDRGLLAPGYRADVNVIDLQALRLHPPTFEYDLPGGGRRLVQRADGYLHTFVGGVEIRAEGVSTDERPGRLIRGAQPDPGKDHL